MKTTPKNILLDILGKGKVMAFSELGDPFVLHCALLLRMISCVISAHALKTESVFLYTEPCQ